MPIIGRNERNFLDYTDLPLVSIDFQGDSRSSIVDGQSTKVIGNSVKVLSWYDNEWGYFNRMLDLILHMDNTRILISNLPVGRLILCFMEPGAAARCIMSSFFRQMVMWVSPTSPFVF